MCARTTRYRCTKLQPARWPSAGGAVPGGRRLCPPPLRACGICRFVRTFSHAVISAAGDGLRFCRRGAAGAASGVPGGAGGAGGMAAGVADGVRAPAERRPHHRAGVVRSEPGAAVVGAGAAVRRRILRPVPGGGCVPVAGGRKQPRAGAACGPTGPASRDAGEPAQPGALPLLGAGDRAAAGDGVARSAVERGQPCLPGSTG